MWAGLAAALVLVLAAVLIVAVLNRGSDVPPEEDDSASLPGQFYPSLGNEHLAEGQTSVHLSVPSSDTQTAQGGPAVTEWDAPSLGAASGARGPTREALPFPD